MVLWQCDDERHCVIRVKSVAVVNFMDIQLIGNCWLLLKLYGGLMWCDLPSELTHGNQFSVPFKIDDDRSMKYVVYTLHICHATITVSAILYMHSNSNNSTNSADNNNNHEIYLFYFSWRCDRRTDLSPTHAIIKISSDWIRQLELIVDLFA